MTSVEDVAEAMYEVLLRCLDATEAEGRKLAEEELRAAEERPDFFASLAMILTAGQDVSDGRVRWLACVCAKNAVRRRWRPRKVSGAAGAVTDEERSYVRDVFLEAVATKVDEPLIAIQVSEWISRVARIDFPEQWPSLFHDLVQRYFGAEDLRVVLQAVTTVDMVLKQLATRRLLQDRKLFRATANEFFDVLLRLFIVHTKRMDGTANDLSFGIVVRCLKALRRLIVSGMETVAENPRVRDFLTVLSSAPHLFVVGMSGGSDVQQRLALLAGKVVTLTQARHPVSFYEYLPHFMEVSFNQLLTYKAGVVPERVMFQAARLLRNVAQCPEYKISREVIDQFRAGSLHPSEPHVVVAKFVLTFFNTRRTEAFVKACLSSIFVLSATELETWVADPETLVQDEESAEWRAESVRNECEELLQTLLVREKPRIAGLLLGATEELNPQSDPLRLDACYRAIGKCVYDLDKVVPFEQWLQHQLGPILMAPSSPNVGVRVLKARAAWLTGQFVGQLSRPARSAVYSLLVPLLSFEGNDPVVALTASGSLKHVVEDLGFYGTDFTQYFALCLSSVLKMSGQSENIETKRDLLTFACSLIERCPIEAVSPLVDDIATVLPGMWESASSMTNPRGTMPPGHVDGWEEGGMDEGSGNLFRTSLVLIITALLRKVGALGTRSSKLVELSLAIVSFGTDLSNPDSGAIYMMEEACILWEVLISALETYLPNVVCLIPRALSILSVDFDHMQVMYKILEGYALLGKLDFFQAYGKEVAALLEQALFTLRDRGCYATCEVIELLLQLFPEEGPGMFGGSLRHAMTSACSGRESRGLASAYTGLLLRGVVSNSQRVEEVVMRGDPNALVLSLDLGIDKLDNMYLLSRRKLAVVGLCILVDRHCGVVPGVQERVPRVLGAVAKVLIEESAALDPANRQKTKLLDFDNHVARFGENEEALDEERTRSLDGAILPGSVLREEISSRDPSQVAEMQVVTRNLLQSLLSKGQALHDSVIAATDQEVLGKLRVAVRPG